MKRISHQILIIFVLLASFVASAETDFCSKPENKKEPSCKGSEA